MTKRLSCYFIREEGLNPYVMMHLTYQDLKDKTDQMADINFQQGRRDQLSTLKFDPI